MELKKPHEYQTIRLFAILGLLTLMLVLLFRVVLFAPQSYETSRHPSNQSDVPNLNAPTRPDSKGQK